MPPLMKKIVVLTFALFCIAQQTYSYKPSFFGDEIENSAHFLADKLNLNDQAVLLAMTGYEKLKQQGKLINSRYLSIADFSKPSNEQRFYIIDMFLQTVVLQTLMAHGKNSGTLFAKYFSNRNRSNQSSLGFYITGSTYSGKHGKSLELEGVEKGINDKAHQRAIVLHGADYVSNNYIHQQGFLGRSLGCPAVPNHLVKNIIETIQGASCFFIYAPDKKYLDQSRLIN